MCNPAVSIMLCCAVSTKQTTAHICKAPLTATAVFQHMHEKQPSGILRMLLSIPKPYSWTNKKAGACAGRDADLQAQMEAAGPHETALTNACPLHANIKWQYSIAKGRFAVRQGQPHKTNITWTSNLDCSRLICNRYDKLTRTL